MWNHTEIMCELFVFFLRGEVLVIDSAAWRSAERDGHVQILASWRYAWRRPRERHASVSFVFERSRRARRTSFSVRLALTFLPPEPVVRESLTCRRWRVLDGAADVTATCSRGLRVFYKQGFPWNTVMHAVAAKSDSASERCLRCNLCFGFLSLNMRIVFFKES